MNKDGGGLFLKGESYMCKRRKSSFCYLLSKGLYGPCGSRERRVSTMIAPKRVYVFSRLSWSAVTERLHRMIG